MRKLHFEKVPHESLLQNVAILPLGYAMKVRCVCGHEFAYEKPCYCPECNAGIFAQESADGSYQVMAILPPGTDTAGLFGPKAIGWVEA